MTAVVMCFFPLYSIYKISVSDIGRSRGPTMARSVYISGVYRHLSLSLETKVAGPLYLRVDGSNDPGPGF